jgi:cytidylate kinase
MQTPELNYDVLPAKMLQLYDIEAGVSVGMSGGSYRKMAEAMGLSEQHFHRLRLKYAPFSELVSHARKVGLDAVHDSVLTVVDDNLHLSPQLVKIKADQIQFYLKTSDPVRFGDRVLVQNENINLRDALSQARTRVIEHQPKTDDSDPFAGT